MSGSIGADRIPRQAVEATVKSYTEQVLDKYKGVRSVKITGSYNTVVKFDHGDIDLVLTVDSPDDVKTVKRDFVNFVNTLPDSVIVPFKAGRHQGKKSAGTGDIVIVQFPIEGFPGKNVQIDNMIVTSEEESDYRKNFLDIPGEKQALMMGVAKVVALEDSYDVYKRLGITGIPKIEDNQELEFTFSGKGISLRVVTLEGFREIARTEIWKSYNWSDVKKLFLGILNIDDSFEDILEGLINLRNPRSKRRILGIFKSVLIIGAGEVGTPKGDGKQKAFDKASETLSEVLSNGASRVALYAGGFKPPHMAHFTNAEYLSRKVDKLIVFIGTKLREGIPVTADQSKRIWEIYAKYLPIDVEIQISPVTPIRSLYEWVESNQESVKEIVIGTGMEGEEVTKRFGTFLKNPDKYPKVLVKAMPLVSDDEGGKFSASTIRTSLENLQSVDWIPNKLSVGDIKKVISIVTNSMRESKMQKEIGDTLETFFKGPLDESSSGTAIAPQSVIRSEDRTRLENLYNKLKTSVGQDFFVIFNQNHIRIEPTYEGQKVGFDYTPYMSSILEYMMGEGIKVEPLPEIKVRRDINEADSFFGKTGYYNPELKEVVLYIEGRHPKDVMRSFAHEMIHHSQNLEGKLIKVEGSNVNEDSDLLKLEEEAYLKGNRTFRKWEDSLK